MKRRLRLLIVVGRLRRLRSRAPQSRGERSHSRQSSISEVRGAPVPAALPFARPMSLWCLPPSRGWCTQTVPKASTARGAHKARPAAAVRSAGWQAQRPRRPRRSLPTRDLTRHQ